MKICKICRFEKDLSFFYKNGTYLRPECKDCTDLKQSAARFGLTVERLLEIYAEQNYVCAICKNPCDIKRNLAIDHDHGCCPEDGRSCGKCVRGLLCSRCNRGLGLFRDSREILVSAVAYMTR